MGRNTKQNHRIDQLVEFLALKDGEYIDLNSPAVRELRSLIEARLARTPRHFMKHNQWQGYRVFESCAEKSRLDTAGNKRKLLEKQNYDELRAVVAEPPMLTVARMVEPHMVDSAYRLMRQRDRFSRPRGLKRQSVGCCGC